jgi:hypothetical protein
MSAPMMILGSQPPAAGMPFSGNTMNSATMLGRTAPSSTARNQYAPGAASRSRGQITVPQTPPQNARDSTAGTPSGGAGVMSYGARGNAPDSQSSVSTLW